MFTVTFIDTKRPKKVRVTDDAKKKKIKEGEYRSRSYVCSTSFSKTQKYF